MYPVKLISGLFPPFWETFSVKQNGFVISLTPLWNRSFWLHYQVFAMDSGPQDFLCRGLASSNFFHQRWVFFSLSFPCYSCQIHIVLFFINWKHGSYENIAIKVRNPLFLPFLIHPYALNCRNSLKILKKYFYVFFIILTPFSSNVDLRKMYSIILYTRFTSSLKFHLYPPSRTWQFIRDVSCESIQKQPGFISAWCHRDLCVLPFAPFTRQVNQGLSTNPI